MNIGIPSTGLKHAQILVNLYLSYMGHNLAHHGWLLFFLKLKEKSQQEGFFYSFVHTFTGGLWADGITAMVIKECCVLLYCIRLSVAPQLLWSYL